MNNHLHKLEKNIINLLGSKGKIWLGSLPTIIEKLSDLWSLTDIRPVSNMSWNYVATAVMNAKKAVVLKISSDRRLIIDEYRTLQHFDGHGAIRVIHFNSEYYAMLLEQAIPGTLLKDHHVKKPNEIIAIYANVVKKISGRPLLENYPYRHVRDWLKDLDKITDKRIEKHFLTKALQLRENLLNTATNEYLCHGDLHLENIIQHDTHWLVIDPKGMMGEMAFEAAAFDLADDYEKENTSAIASLILERTALLAELLKLDMKRLLSWIFLRMILSAQWSIEDNGDPSDMITMAGHVYPLLNTHGS